jgi:hypothetical protein
MDGRKGQKEDERDKQLGHDKNGDRVRGGWGWAYAIPLRDGKKRRFPREGTRGCGEVTELELSDRNDAKALAARGDKNDAGSQVA